MLQDCNSLYVRTVTPSFSIVMPFVLYFPFMLSSVKTCIALSQMTLQPSRTTHSCQTRSHLLASAASRKRRHVRLFRDLYERNLPSCISCQAGQAVADVPFRRGRSLGLFSVVVVIYTRMGRDVVAGVRQGDLLYAYA